MKLAIHQPRVSYYVGGGEKVPLFQAEYLAQLGNEVTIVTTPSHNEAKLYTKLKSRKDLKIKFVEIEIPQKHQYLYEIEPGKDHYRWRHESIAFGIATEKFYLENQFDLVISHYITDSIHIPYSQINVCHLHGYPSIKNDMYNAFIKFPDALISASNNVVDKWNDFVTYTSNMHVNYYGVELFSNTMIDSILNRGTANLLYVGRLLETKGLTYLIEAAQILKQRKINFKLKIAGEGEFRQNIEEMIKERRLEEYVELLGQQSSPEDYYRQADICIFPSYEREGLMNTALEAMSMGRPVISCKGIALEEIIDGSNGILVEPKNSSEIANAIAELIKNPQKAREIGLKGRLTIEKNWTWEKRVKELNDIYKQILMEKKQ